MVCYGPLGSFRILKDPLGGFQWDSTEWAKSQEGSSTFCTQIFEENQCNQPLLHCSWKWGWRGGTSQNSMYFFAGFPHEIPSFSRSKASSSFRCHGRWNAGWTAAGSELLCHRRFECSAERSGEKPGSQAQPTSLRCEIEVPESVSVDVSWCQLMFNDVQQKIRRSKTGWDSKAINLQIAVWD